MKKLILIALILIPNVANASVDSGWNKELERARITNCFNIYMKTSGYIGRDTTNPVCGKIWIRMNEFMEENNIDLLNR